MNLKISLLITFCFGSFLGAMAQTSDAEADAVVNLLGVQKKEAVAKLVAVSGEKTLWHFGRFMMNISRSTKPLQKPGSGYTKKPRRPIAT